MYPKFSEFSVAQTNGTDGTALVRGIPPHPLGRVYIRRIRFLSVTDAKTLNFVHPLAETTVSAAAIAGATTLVLSRDPGNYSAWATAQGRPTPSVANNLIASGDYHCIALPDGTFLFGTNSGATTNADGTVNLTVAALPAGGVAAGAKFWFFGLAADINPVTGARSASLPAAGSAATLDLFSQGPGSINCGHTIGQPALFYTDATGTTGSLQMLNGDYGH